MPWTTDKTRIYSKEQKVMINKLEEKLAGFRDSVVEAAGKSEARVNMLIRVHALTMVLVITLICAVMVVK